jgi:prepilin-type N-terminal cleavage/methylation domain-containing protein
MSRTHRRIQRGFTLVELMIVVAIIGILAAIAFPAFSTYAKKSKYGEAELGLAQITQKVKIYKLNKSAMPPSTNTMPSTTACASSTGKTARTTQSTWQANAGWKALEFHQDQPGYFQYVYTNLGTTSGMVQATGDLDCDGTTGTVYYQLAAAQGNITSTRFDFSAAD